jgi:hypothetical protein
LLEIFITKIVKDGDGDGDGLHGEIMAHMSGKKICIHNKHHNIYEMGKLQQKLKSEVRTHKIAKNTIWRM